MAAIDNRVAKLERANAELRGRLTARTRELMEAREQQTATSEILDAISRSPTDLQPVFDAIVASAARLCNAEFTAVARFDDGLLHLVAINNMSPEETAAFHSLFPRLPTRNFAMGRAFLEGRWAQFADVLAEPDYDARTREVLQAVAQYRTFLGVPILREGRPIGVIGCARRAVDPFSDTQIGLLDIFADQAAIALENVRLFRELETRNREIGEALAQQTATAEVLQVINSSPGDLAPVFDAMLEKATRLCAAARGQLATYDGERFRFVAVHGDAGFVTEQYAQGAQPPAVGVTWSRIVGGESVVYIADVRDTELYRSGHESARRFVDRAGGRSLVTVALRKDDLLLGALTIYRQEVRPFSEKEIALLENFAAQAVIAMENARLLTETREALAQQTATAEVLGVINSSPGVLAPVFDAMVERAALLTEADEAALRTFDGELLHIAAVHGSESNTIERLRQLGPTRAMGLYEAFGRGDDVVHIADVRLTGIFRENPVVRQRLELRGIRSWLAVALRKEDALLGVINVHRHEVRPFSEKEIALLQNFAAQAVIAMENARLITETREALEQQTATAEVLGVINSSPGDLAPVFDAILEKAHSLCGVAIGALEIWDGERLRALATRGLPREFEELIRQGYEPEPNDPHWALVNGDGYVHVHVPNLGAIDDPTSRTAAMLVGTGTFLAVALRKDNALLGRIVAARPEVRPFSDKEIALLQNFAAQAVIAMENARLLTETREALEQQTATAEVLQVINSSPGDLAPVFDAMLERATRLCEAAFGTLWTYDGERFKAVALRQVPKAYADFLSQAPLCPNPRSGLGRIADGDRFAHFSDVAADEAYQGKDRALRALVELGKARTTIAVPLRTDDKVLGAITAYRQEVRPFSDKQIALLQNFAAQAVIAMENARLITETREALAQQTATAEVLQVINSSPGDLAPVFDTLVETAVRLCDADMAGLALRDGDTYRYVATRSLDPAWNTYLNRLSFTPGRGTITGRTLLERRVVHVADTAADPEHAVPEIVTIGGIKTLLGVPLLREGEPIGVLALARKHVEPFTNGQVALMQTFAGQAVIAIENARLITETREALEQQTATAEVLRVINASPGDIAPVFDVMLEKAMQLCALPFGALWTYDGEDFHPVALRGVPPSLAEALRRPVKGNSETGLGRLAQGAPLVHFEDIAAEQIRHPGSQATAAAGARTFLAIPLRREGTLLGAFTTYRHEVRLFSDKQIALLQNFAAQAVIAIENARLITETREALEQQTATAEVLQVINSSPGDLATVFDAMLEKAMRLCAADFGGLWTFERDRYIAVAVRGVPPAYVEFLANATMVPGPGTAPYRFLRGERLVHNVDLASEEAYRAGDPQRRALVDLGGARTALQVPLRKDDDVLGVITIYRQEVQPFSDKQIALLQNFAAQAVIAIENARLLTETREALEQQTATAEVLQVINSSPGALRPVFDAMLEKAMRLCQAVCGHLYTYDGERFSPAAVRGERGFAEWWEQHGAVRPLPGAGPLGRIAQGERVVVTDYLEDPAYRAIPRFKALVDAGGLRSAVAVALRKDDALLGSIHIYRQEVQPFSDKQIALLQNFAAQAVIAMENARLLTETREALEYQTATSDVLRVISGSAFDLAPVLETAVATAVRLCRADQAVIYRNFDGEYRWAAGYSLAPEYERIEREITIRPGTGSVVGRAALECGTVQILDAWTDPVYEAKADARVGGIHTLLGVPLLRDGVPLGVIGLARRRVEAFAPKEIELVRTFADQAVIAIENARLLGELRHRTEELGQQQAVLRVTFDNMADGVVRFDEGLRLAAWNRNFVEVLDLPDRFLAEPRTYADLVRYLAGRGEYGAVDPETELRRLIENAHRQWTAERTRPDGRVLEVRHNPVPGGGFVLIYGDITERKRAEGEVRAARDAAERALRELQTAQASLVHAQKMAALGQLTAGVAHEIKNPLNFVNNFAGLSVELLDELKQTAAPAVALLDQRGRAEIDELVAMLTGNLEKIAEHGRRADGIVKSMLDHSRTGGSERRHVDINAVIEEALNLAYHGARAQDQNFDITLECDLERGIAPIELVPQDLTRVFLNLFGNGFYAADKRRRETADAGFRAILKVASRDFGDEVEVRVRDNGTGIAPEIRDKLFQPFFTTKPTGEGTGLGLSISYDIVTQQHGGTITVNSIFGEFTEFTIRLPRRVATGASLPAGTDVVSGGWHELG